MTVDEIKEELDVIFRIGENTSENASTDQLNEAIGDMMMLIERLKIMLNF